MAAIDIGAEAKDRNMVASPGRTRINEDNPANDTGNITSVEIWANTNLSGCKVGTFYKTNGNTLKCRATATIGNVTAGSKQTFSGLSISVQTGDYIGSFWSGGAYELSDDEGVGYWWSDADDYCDVGDEHIYSYSTPRALSLYGTGETAAGLSIPVAMATYTKTRNVING